MDDIDQLYAACVIEYARRQENHVLAGPFYVIGKDARDAFNLPYDKDIFTKVISILEELGSLSQYSRKGMQTFYKIDAKKFDQAMKPYALNVRNYQVRGEISENRVEYGFLEAFADIGSEYLVDALDSYEDAISAIGDEVDQDDASIEYPNGTVESSQWTGLPKDFSLTEDRRVALVRELDKIEVELEGSDASQHERAQARAIVIAARALAEAPDPPIDLIWELIGRANSLAGIASLFVSVFTLILSAT